ncbi:MAG: hypothetical protein KAI47_20215, partial [Deltaproteobacteria bacterium]|nr:hypothetical protein [Deltaproteobacteria bacterium]
MKHRRHGTSLGFLGVLVGLLGAAPSHGQSIQKFSADVVEQDVTYKIEGCASLGLDHLLIYHDLTAPPDKNTPIDGDKVVGGCSPKSPIYPFDSIPFTVPWANAPIGLYKSYLRFGQTDQGPIAGPIEVCVGPDVHIKSFRLEQRGANLTYIVRICNDGSMAARKFRVGFWPDRSTAPAAADMGIVFKGIVELAPYTCYDMDNDGKEDELHVSGGVRPNGDFTAWARIDSGDFVVECREGNNTANKIPYKMRNPDLYVSTFKATVNGATVTYTVEVCNKGAADVPKFFVDVYFDRPKNAPIFGEPGDLADPVFNLA